MCLQHFAIWDEGWFKTNVEQQRYSQYELNKRMNRTKITMAPARF
jgi:hypothetical protein